MAQNWLSLLRPARRGPSRRAIVVPHAGAGPNALAPMWECLPDDVEVVGVTLPGRERRFAEQASGMGGDPDVVVSGVLRDIARLRPAPTVLFGHSLGAAIAAAVADAEPGPFHSLVLSAYPTGPAEPARGPAEQRQRLLDLVDRAGGTPTEVTTSPLWREHLLAVLGSDIALADGMADRVLRPLRVPVTVLHGAEDQLVAPTEPAVWESRAAAGVRFRTLPGGHFYLLDDMTRYAVATEIAATLSYGAAAA
ncbi:MAG TPA: alpha/beta fold hydrolase [Pseudonocardiaceae bacterium]|nr:alpha/beta fold hydrolase [Pseudonocardiaceae bacterium]